MDALDFWRNRGTQRLLLNDVWTLMNGGGQPLQSTEQFENHHKHESFFPACDLSEDEENYFLSLDMPGIKKKNIDIEVLGNQLTISGKRHKDEQASEKNVTRVERSFGEFRRTFTVPEGINVDVIHANYMDGVLEVLIPKAEEKKSKKIEIGSGDKNFLQKLSPKAKAVNS